MTQARGRTRRRRPAVRALRPRSPPLRPHLPPRDCSQRILIVEDEPALLRALRINLRARGYDVATAPTGREALAEAQRRPPDAVLLDLGLPDLDGTQVIRQLRGWSTAPVIVLSGRAGPGDKIGALDAGADDYVTKPFSMEELLARLRAALRREDQPADGTTLPSADCADRPRPVTSTRSTAAPEDAGRPGRAGPSHAHRVAAAGDPAARPGPAGEFG